MVNQVDQSFYIPIIKFIDQKRGTHATTNLNAAELKGRYGNRERSRMRELFNPLAFDKVSLD